MISKKHISRNLSELNKLYTSAKGNLRPQFYAKLAIIETCGWIEECIDSIFESLAVAKLSTSEVTTYRRDTIKKTSGFQYDNYIRQKLLKDLIGLVLVEKLENTLIADRAFITMKSALNTLSIIRNANAHTHISGTTPSIMAPSSTISHFNECYDGLKVLNKELKKIKFK